MIPVKFQGVQVGRVAGIDARTGFPSAHLGVLPPHPHHPGLHFINYNYSLSARAW